MFNPSLDTRDARTMVAAHPAGKTDQTLNGGANNRMRRSKTRQRGKTAIITHRLGDLLLGKHRRLPSGAAKAHQQLCGLGPDRFHV
jgi:hypothetical protein